MLTERLSRLFARAAPGARAAGLVDDAITLAARHRERRAAWAPHLAATRRVIAEHLQRADRAGPIVVLGAGVGRDLPLNELHAHPAGARLVDAVLLPETRLDLRAWPKIEFEVRDVTGMLERHAKSRGGELVECPMPAPLPVAGAGMVVSVNLLSQLVLPFATSPAVDDADRATADRVHRAHLEALRRAPCPVLLITDYARREVREGRVTRLSTVSVGLVEAALPGCKVAEWDWTVAPLGELGADVVVTFEVGAWFRP